MALSSNTRTEASAGADPVRQVVPLRLATRNVVMLIGAVAAEVMVTRIGRRAQRPPRFSSPQLIEMVGAVTDDVDSRIALPLSRVTVPEVEIEKVVALDPRTVVPRAGDVWGETVIWACASDATRSAAKATAGINARCMVATYG
ncbi:hypothetical protein GCM10009422_18900 [Brevundimonas kwangchunensis]|uniref:Uncharacterized protein n=1 Tax=Brevundimonas kwangchunensis TaxID=322163 RepID=A0ABN1GY06_9CAUL